MDQDAQQRRLRRLFCDGFKAMDIASPLPSFHPSESPRTIVESLTARDQQVCLIRANGVNQGFLRLSDLTDSGLSTLPAANPITEEMLLRQEASLRDAVLTLAEVPICFITVLGEISAVITPADARKPPLRMWLFGMITIMEMYLHRLLITYFPNDSWQAHLSAGRIEKAEALRAERMRRKEVVPLVECLQITDKVTILMHSPEAIEAMHLESKREARAAIKELESLRNNLAHGQDIVQHNADPIITLAKRLDIIITRA